MNNSLNITRTQIIIAAVVAAIAALILLLVIVVKPFGSGGIDTDSVSYRKGYDNAASPAGVIPGIDYDCSYQWHAYAAFGSHYDQNSPEKFQAGCQAYVDTH